MRVPLSALGFELSLGANCLFGKKDVFVGDERESVKQKENPLRVMG